MEHMEQNDKAQKSIERATLTVVMITNFCSLFSVTAVNIAVPHIGVEFNASATSITWIVLSMMIVTISLSIPFGRVADIYGKFRIFKYGLVFVCAGALLTILSPNMLLFIIFRVLQGIGFAMIFATGIALLAEVFPANRRGWVIGVTSSTVFVGQACGPPLGGFLINAFGWRSVFIAIFLLLLVSLVVTMARSPKDKTADAAQKLNASSIALFIISTGLLMYGFSSLSQNVSSYFVFAAGIGLTIFYIKRETRTESPVIEIRLFIDNPVFTRANAISILNYAAVFSISYFLSIYLQLVKGFTADFSGLIMFAQPILQTILSPISGRLSDKHSPASIATAGMAFCAGAMFMLSFLKEQTPVSYIVVSLLLAGLGVAFFAPPNNTLIMGSVGSKDYSMASSVLSTTRSIGQVVGMAILTIVVNQMIGNVPIKDVVPASIVGVMHISFLIFMAVCILGTILSPRRPK